MSTPFLLRAVGLISPPADVVYGYAPDIYASEQVGEVLSQANLEGVKVYVIPEQGTKTQTAFVILDSSAGFDGFSDLDDSADESVVDARMEAVLRNLAARNDAENLGIKRVAIDYRDENGETFMTMTTTMAEIEAYLEGSLSPEEFYGEFGFGLGDMVRQMMEALNE